MHYFHVSGGGQEQELKAAAHIACAIKKQREMDAAAQWAFSFLCNSEPTQEGTMLSRPSGWSLIMYVPYGGRAYGYFEEPRSPQEPSLECIRKAGSASPVVMCSGLQVVFELGSCQSPSLWHTGQG